MARCVTLMCGLVMMGMAGCASREEVRAPADGGLPQIEVVAEFPDQQVTGVAVSKDGRVFVSFPRWRDGVDVSVGELRADGSVRALPDGRWNSWSEADGGAQDKWVCVQAVWVDPENRLWVIDPASPKMAGVASGGAKLVRIDVATGDVERVYALGNDVAPRDSYMNDVRVDLTARRAFITDSGLGGIVVVDIDSGEAKRVLSEHVSTRGAKGLVPVVEGRELRFVSGPNAGQPAAIHSDGIALDAEGGWLYWQALTSKRLFRAPVAALALGDENAARRSVEDMGATVVTDGMEIGPRGEVVFTALERDAIMMLDLDARTKIVASSPLLAWPDAPAWGPDGWMYVSVSQIHRTEWFSEDAPPTEPYRIVRFRWPR